MIYDVLVIGAGPSGSYFAYLMAKSGHSVLVIDKEVFPRDKVCGGGISNKTVEILDIDISPVVQKNIVGAYLCYKNTDYIIKDIVGRSGVTVNRNEFDYLILSKAIEAGAAFESKCAFESVASQDSYLQVQTTSGLFKTRYLIGADGVFSQVRNRVFGKDLVTYAPAIEALVYVDQETIGKFENRTLLDFGGINRGYGWIFPKRDHLNTGLFSIYGSKNLRSELTVFMDRYKSLSKYQKIVIRGFSIPLKNKKSIYEIGNIILIGDAAGFAESFYGEGIYFALKSAKIAAQAITHALETREVGLYTKSVKELMLEDLFYSELNAKLFFPVQKFGFYNMVRNIHVNNYFAELIAGKVSYKECFYKTLLTSPYWMFSKKYQYSKMSL